jgi:hypothetical protein
VHARGLQAVAQRRRADELEQAIPFRSELPWTTLGAVPEMLETA